MSAEPLTHASMFTGVGGFDTAMHRAGVRNVATCEVDKAARGVLAERFPESHHFTDIKDVTADDLRSVGFVPRRGILTAGFPCQDLSVAGRRAGMGVGTRSGLYWELDRLMDELAPEWVIFENVPGLLSSTCPCTGDGACQLDGRGPVRCPGELHTVTGGACPGGCIATHGGTMGAVLGSMGHRGYGFAYRVLDAQRFGVPQRRRRVFIVGRLGDDGRSPAQVLAEFQGSGRNLAPSPQAWARLADRTRGRARAARSGLLADTGIVRALTGRQGESGIDLTDAEAGHVIATEAYVVEPESGQGADLRARETDVAPALTATGEAQQTDRGVRVVKTYRKAGRAQSTADDETWVEADTSNTVNTFDVGDTRATELVVEAPAVADTLTSGSHSPNVSAPGRRQEDDTNLVVTPITTRNATRTTDSDTAGFGVGDEGDPSSSLQTSGVNAVCVTGDVTHTLTHEGHDASEDGTGRGTPIVSPAVTAKWAKGTGGPSGDEAQNLTTTGPTTVRRLTPLECERLQGFDDNHTAVSNGKKQADSARYKQMGNSLAVPVAEWIAHGLVAVDQLERPAS